MAEVEWRIEVLKDDLFNCSYSVAVQECGIEQMGVAYMTWLARGGKYDSEEEANAVAYEHRQPWYLDVHTDQPITPVPPEHFGRRSSIKKRVLIRYFKNGTTFRDQVLAVLRDPANQ